MSFTSDSVVLMQDCHYIKDGTVNRWHLPYLYPTAFAGELYVRYGTNKGMSHIPPGDVQVWGADGYIYRNGEEGGVTTPSIALSKAITACMQLPLDVVQQLPIDVVMTHLPAMLRTRPGYIRYLARPEHLSDNRWTIVKAGRFLRRHCPQLSDEDVKQLTSAITGACTEYKLEFTAAGDADKIADVYRHGPNSCQSGYMPYSHGNIRVDGEFYAPVRIYAHPENNLRLAYLVNSDGQYAARAWVNLKTMTHNTVYASTDTFHGSDFVMHTFLSEAGYSHYGEETMRGEVLLKVDTDCGAIICPYIDPQNLGVDIYDDHLEVGGHHSANYETGCLEGYDPEGNGSHCDRCEGRYHEDDLRYVEDTEESVCADCLSEDFVWAEVGGYFEYDYIHHENAETLICGASVSYQHLRRGDFVEVEWGRHRGEYCRDSEAVHCGERGWCYTEDVREQGLHYCYECESLMLPDDHGACPLCGEEDNYEV